MVVTPTVIATPRHYIGDSLNPLFWRLDFVPVIGSTDAQDPLCWVKLCNSSSRSLIQTIETFKLKINSKLIVVEKRKSISDCRCVCYCHWKHVKKSLKSEARTICMWETLSRYSMIKCAIREVNLCSYRCRCCHQQHIHALSPLDCWTQYGKMAHWHEAEIFKVHFTWSFPSYRHVLLTSQMPISLSYGLSEFIMPMGLRWHSPNSNSDQILWSMVVSNIVETFTC